MSFIFSRPNEKYVMGKRRGIEAYTKKGTREPVSFWEAIKRLGWSRAEFDSFNKGFYDGFDETMRNTEIIQNVNFMRNENRETGNTFAKQIQLLEEIKENLNGFAKQLEDDSLEYARKVDSVTVNGGMLDDIAGDFYNLSLTPAMKEIGEIVEKIKTRDTKLIDNEIAFLKKHVKSN